MDPDDEPVEPVEAGNAGDGGQVVGGGSGCPRARLVGIALAADQGG